MEQKVRLRQTWLSPKSSVAKATRRQRPKSSHNPSNGKSPYRHRMIPSQEGFPQPLFHEHTEMGARLPSTGVPTSMMLSRAGKGGSSAMTSGRYLRTFSFFSILCTIYQLAA
ncbi:MAG: hypothetical protein M1813_001536 [Trichoglossum hirsutum]|nr:MAG: hypothetical protein M1813_001536 [Trichoglossum hirsutum]